SRINSSAAAYIVPLKSLRDPSTLALEAVSPPVGHVDGGDIVRVFGAGLWAGTRFLIDGRDAEIIAGESQRTALVRVPPRPGGPAQGDVTAVRGAKSSVLVRAFEDHAVPLVDLNDLSPGNGRGGDLYSEREAREGAS